MKNQPELNAAKKEKDGWKMLGLTAAFAMVVSAGNVAFLNYADKAQAADPVFVMPVAEQAVEDMGYGNVRIVTFNTGAEDNRARLGFVAEKNFEVYAGEVSCNAHSCNRFKVEKVTYGS